MPWPPRMDPLIKITNILPPFGELLIATTGQHSQPLICLMMHVSSTHHGFRSHNHLSNYPQQC
jgi:hypothetical protein